MKALLERLKKLLEELIVLLTSKLSFNIENIIVWAKAIRTFEGWYPGSRSWRNNNPGNLKYVQQRGTAGYDKDRFAIFFTYDDGWKALINQLRIAMNGKSRVYNPEMTLLEFFEKYAPASDNNHPRNYAEFVAGKLGTSIHTKIKEFA